MNADGGTVNACSVGNKSATFCRMIVDEQLDVLAITETWHERSESTELRRHLVTDVLMPLDHCRRMRVLTRWLSVTTAV